MAANAKTPEGAIGVQIDGKGGASAAAGANADGKADGKASGAAAASASGAGPKIAVDKEGKKSVVFSEPIPDSAKLDSRGWPLMTQGDKKLNACCGRDPPGARDCYEKAANQFKLDEEWEEASNAYIKAAEVAETVTDLEGLEAGRFYESAAKCMRHASPRESLKILEYALKVYLDRVSTGSCAKVYETMADTYEKDLKEWSNAMDAYEKSADNLIAQDSIAKGNAMLIRVATIAASRYDFKRAIGIYERVAAKCAEPSSRYISDGFTLVRHLYSAGLCQLVLAARTGKLGDADAALTKYRGMGNFDRSDECKFLLDLLRAFEESNSQLFTDTCYKYDRTHPLDQWSSTLLLECKQILKGVKAADINVDFDENGQPKGAGVEPDMS